MAGESRLSEGRALSGIGGVGGEGRGGKGGVLGQDRGCVSVRSVCGGFVVGGRLCLCRCGELGVGVVSCMLTTWWW